MYLLAERAAFRETILIWEELTDIRHIHVKNFIITLDDCALAKHLTLVHLIDADDLNETLSAVQRIEVRVN